MPAYDPVKQYLGMYRIRRFEEKLAAIYPDGNMRLPVHFSIGQESAPVAVLSQFTKKDLCYASHRSHAPYLAKGGSPLDLLRELYGLPSGCTGGIGGSMYLYGAASGFGGSFAIVGDAVSVGTGAAFALRNMGRHIVVFIGDSVVETGQFWESVNFAALHRLPLLYVCENNGYATQTPLHQRQPTAAMDGADIHKRVAPWMTTAIHRDTEPQAISEFVQHWANAGGPAFIEVVTNRHVEHVGPSIDMDAQYRDAGDSGRADPMVIAAEGLGDLSYTIRTIEDELEGVFNQAALEAGV